MTFESGVSLYSFVPDVVNNDEQMRRRQVIFERLRQAATSQHGWGRSITMFDKYIIGPDSLRNVARDGKELRLARATA